MTHPSQTQAASPDDIILPPYKVVFLNGPKGSGKSTIARAFQQALRQKRFLPSLVVAHAEPLARATQAIFFPDQPMIDMSAQEVKASPLPLFEEHRMGHDGTLYLCRDFMIDLGSLLRSALGGDVLSRLLMRTIAENEPYYATFIVEGARTREDIEFIRDSVGAENCLLARVYRDGTSFLGDLGGYLLEDYGVLPVDLHNNGPIEATVSTLLERYNAKDSSPVDGRSGLPEGSARG